MTDAKAICDTDIVKYGQANEHILKNEGADVDRLAAVIESLSLPEGEPLQPQDLGGYGPRDSEYVVMLNMSFEAIENTIYEETRGVAKSLNLAFKPGPPKKDERVFEKSALAYDGDFSYVKDFRRASIICETMSEMVHLVDVLSNTEGIEILRVKNRFDRKYVAKELSAGYRDLQMNIRARGTMLVWELQLHLAAIELLKTSMTNEKDENGRTGHGRYVAYREIMERVKKLKF